MPPPKRGHTHGRTRRRRSHHALKPAQFLACAHCGAAALPHRVCMECGYYKGKEVIDVLAKTEKKAKRRKAKAEEVKKEERAGEKPATLEELSKK